jgi:hypothetical protein
MAGVSGVAGTTLQLARLLLPCARDFVRLITLLPELVEPYESVNDDGATVRRYTIINTDTEVRPCCHLPISCCDIDLQLTLVEMEWVREKEGTPPQEVGYYLVHILWCPRAPTPVVLVLLSVRSSSG